MLAPLKVCNEFYENEVPKSVENYYFDALNGFNQYYFPNGNLRMAMNFKKGKLNTTPAKDFLNEL